MFRGKGYRGCLRIPIDRSRSAMAQTLQPRKRVLAYLCHSVFYDLLIRHIALVADQQLVHTLCRIAIDLLKPLLHIIEGIHVRHIVDNADSMSAAIVRGGDGSEALLSSRIPLLSSVRLCSSVLDKTLLTICSFTVFPSSSIVRIFYPHYQPLPI